MSDSMKEKVVLVTGGSSGIGKATALAFSKKGAKLTVVADLNFEGLESTVSQVKDAGGDATSIRVDVSKGADVERLIRTVVEKYGRIDYAVNNAGIEGAMVPTHLCPEDNWDRVLSVNLKGVWLCMKYEIEQMLKQGGGSIVNMSSALGLVGVQGYPAYVAAKHGVVGLTKTAALEYAQAGIRVNAVCAGAIRTPLLDRMIAGNKQIEDFLLSKEPIGRFGTAEEIAEAVVWLCSDAASFVTGHAMSVDGGAVAQ